MNSKVDQEASRLDVVKWSVIVLLVIAGIGANYYFHQVAFTVRLLGWILLVAIVAFLALHTVKGHAFKSFVKEARIELRKVVWPTKQETVRTTMMVIGMVLLVSIALWGVDAILLWIVGWLTGQRG